ncbi:hypothetical protein VTI74DRAFT_9636 [Chaetomium olivicolor]
MGQDARVYGQTVSIRSEEGLQHPQIPASKQRRRMWVAARKFDPAQRFCREASNLTPPYLFDPCNRGALTHCPISSRCDWLAATLSTICNQRVTMFRQLWGCKHLHCFNIRLLRTDFVASEIQRCANRMSDDIPTLHRAFRFENRAPIISRF